MVDQLAVMLEADGDPRPIGELRAAVLADLIRRPWNTRRPAVTAHLHITAPLPSLAGASAEPGDVNGPPITAGHVRELLACIGALGLRAPEGGALTLAITDADGRLLATASRSTLERLARRGCREHPDGGCRCPVLDRPPPTTAYEPTAAQDAFIATRDRTCRFPNCGQRVGWADLDHVVPHACGGATDCANLCCLCRSHHRLKTLARGWRFAMDPDGVLHVTTPVRGHPHHPTTRPATTPATRTAGAGRCSTAGITSPGHRSPALLTTREARVGSLPCRLVAVSTNRHDDQATTPG